MALESSSISNIDKLELPIDDEYWQDRKAIIKHMIEHGINPTTITYANRRPFHENIQLKDFNFACYLLRQKADPNNSLFYSRTPLHVTIDHLNKKK